MAQVVVQLLQLCSIAALLALANARHHPYEGYTVHVIFSNHLDVGFTDLDSNVIDLYFHHHFPHAIKLAKELAAASNNTHGDRFRYMSHSWLLSLFLDCPPNMGWTCPNVTEVQQVEEAIQQGIITWHAMPYNPQYEVFDASLLRFAVDLTHSLDDRFTLPQKRMASLRDVPGLTRAAIPILASKGVRALTGGVNGFSAPPGVPKTTPFIWLDEQSGQQLLAMWHPGGYAGVRKDGLHIDSHRDCIRAPGLKHVMCASWGDDNLGPPLSVDVVQAMFAHVRQQWPGATVIGSSLEDYYDQLTAALAAGGLKLPVVTGELGDTWIHGIASDPGRMADYRAVLRARRTCEEQQQQQEHTADADAIPGEANACDIQSTAYFNFSRLLAKVPEHTWGVSFNAYFGDFTNYTNSWLHNHLAEGEEAHPGLAVSVESWRRQRRYIDWALEALPADHPIVTSVRADRTARQDISTVDPHKLMADGATPLMHTQQQQSVGEAGQHRAAGDKQHKGLDPEDGDMVDDKLVGVGLSAAGRSSARHACAALAAEGAASGGGSVGAADDNVDDGLVFCSKSWLVQVDRKTGGLLRVQRVYGEGEDIHLGNDWARGCRHAAHCSTQNHPQQQQQSPPQSTYYKREQEGGLRASPEEDPVLSSVSWWGGVLTSLAKWLPAPESAAAAAEFALGDEATYHGPPTRGGAQREGSTDSLAQTASATQWDSTPAAAAADSADQTATPSQPTAVFRKLLSFSSSKWPSWLEPLGKEEEPQEQHQQQQEEGEDKPTGADYVGSSSKCHCGHSSAFAELQYNVYHLADFDFVWDNYAYIHPIWEGDFGKWNMSASSNLSAVAKPRLVEIFDHSSDTAGLLLHLQLAFPHKLVKQAGAPRRAWLLLQAPPGSQQLQISLVWQNKTATRLPEALWLRFKPGGGAVDETSWAMNKLDGWISPAEILLNGSHSLHAISSGVRVASKSGDELLTISSMDVPLVNVGEPIPFPNPCRGPDMRQGVAFNPVNNIWGTNYAMWVPFIPSDANMAFRFVLEAQQVAPRSAPAA